MTENTGLRWCPRKDVLLKRTNIKKKKEKKKKDLTLCNRLAIPCTDLFVWTSCEKLSSLLEGWKSNNREKRKMTFSEKLFSGGVTKSKLFSSKRVLKKKLSLMQMLFLVTPKITLSYLAGLFLSVVKTCRNI